MRLTRGIDEGQECFNVITRNATYSYQSSAGGFSSICDVDGIDWINFHPGEPDVPSGAAHTFRGLPNLVHPDGIGHPGFRCCSSNRSIEDGAIHIETQSDDGLWFWRLRFFDSYVRLRVVRTPDMPFWFLYEGTVGGTYEPWKSFWSFPSGRMTPQDLPAEKLSSSFPAAGERWAYFGHDRAPRVFFCARINDGGEESVLYFMGADERKLDSTDGMIVFGFGRGEGITKRLTGPHEFVFGFIEETDHNAVAHAIDAILDGSG